jgi:hypothetical protein
MPLYFAYGSNMDKTAMARRCPQARVLGLARLARHRFFITTDGTASVRRHPNTDVLGVLYELSFADLTRLDRYEDLASGLYVKISQPVLRQGAASVRALLYIGTAMNTGEPKPLYLEAIIGSARDWRMPETYIAYLESLASSPSNLSQGSTSFRAIKLKSLS